MSTDDMNSESAAENHVEFDKKVQAALAQCNGSDSNAITLITGISKDEINDLGGIPETRS